MPIDPLTNAPYGLRHQVRLPEVYNAPPPTVVYDPRIQLNVTANGLPLVRQPELMRLYSVTWETTDNDNKTDDGG